MKRQEDELGKPTARSAELVTESFDDGRVVYDERTHAAHSLRSDVAAVWDLCDGRRTPEEIASSLRLDPELVQCALYELEVCDLLEPEELPAVSGIGGLRLDRRSMLKRTAMVGGGVALISSVFVPSAFAFGSTSLVYTVSGSSAATSAAATGTSTGNPDHGSPTTVATSFSSGNGANSTFCDLKGDVGTTKPASNYVEVDLGISGGQPVAAVTNNFSTAVTVKAVSNGVTVYNGSVAAGASTVSGTAMTNNYYPYIVLTTNDPFTITVS